MKCLVISTYRTFFGNILYHHLIKYNVKFYAIVLLNNPYHLKLQRNSLFNLKFLKTLLSFNKNKNDYLLYFDRVEHLLEDNFIKFQFIPDLKSEYIKYLIKNHKFDCILLGDAPLIPNEIIEIAYNENIPIINFHAAELPFYRGNYATYQMIKDYKPLCITAHLIDKFIDKGFILDKYYLESNYVFDIDSFYSIEIKLWILGMDYFIRKINDIIILAKDYIKGSRESYNYQSSLVKISKEERYKIRNEIDKYIEKVYEIEIPQYSKFDGMVYNLSRNSKICPGKIYSMINEKVETDIGNYKAEEIFSLDFENNLLNPQYKFELIHADSTRIYTNNLFDQNFPANIRYPADKKWCIILTHDVDIIPKNLKLIEKAIEIEKQFGFSSTYLLASLKSIESRHPNDPNYTLKEDTTKELIYYILANHHEVGLHGSYNSYNNYELLKDEKMRLEDFISMEIKSIRQHYLNYDKNITPFIHEKCGFICDSSLGFPSKPGCKNSYSFPYFPYIDNLKRNSKVLTIPYLIMDQNIFWNEELDGKSFKDKLDYIKKILNSVKKKGGVVVLDWHLHTIEEKEWWELYSEILEYIKNDKTSFISRMDQFYYAYILLNHGGISCK